MGFGQVPLTALGVKVPEQPDFIGNAARVMQLRELANANALAPGQQQLQQQQIQAGQQNLQIGQQNLAMNQQLLASRQGLQKTISEWDPAKDNIEDFPAKASQNGVLPQDIKPFIDMQESLTKNKTANLDFMQKKQGIITDGLSAVLDSPDEQLAANATGKLQELSQIGAIDAPTAQKLGQAVQQNSQNPAALRQQLEGLEKSMGIQTQMLGYAKDKATIGQEQSGAFKEVTGTGMFFNPNTGETKTAEGSVLSPSMMESKYVGIQQAKAAGQTISPQDQAFSQGYEKFKTLVPQFNFNLQGGTGGGLTGPALDQAAQRFGQTGVLPSLGMGAVGAQTRKAIMNRAAEIAPAGNIAVNSAEYKANQTSLTNVQKNFDQVNAFENTAGKNLDLFLGTAQKAIDSGSPWVNTPLRAVAAGGLGSADLAAFNAARTTALTEIAKVLNSSNASGVLSDSARSEVGQLIGPNASLKQIVSAANILKQDMANRHDAYQEQIGDIQNRLQGAQGGGPAQSGAPSKPPTATHTAIGDTDKKKHWLDAQGNDLGLVQ